MNEENLTEWIDVDAQLLGEKELTDRDIIKGGLNLHRRHLQNTACTNNGENQPPSSRLSKIPTGYQSCAVDTLQVL